MDPFTFIGQGTARPRFAMKAMMMVESGMDRHISTSPPSNGALAVEHLHQRHHPEGNGDAHHHALLVREEDATSAGGKAAAARSPRSPSGGFANDNRGNPFLAALFLGILAVENTASMLARRYAVGVIRLKFSKNAVLAVNELMKLAFCLFMATRDPQKHGGGGINATTRRRRRRAHLRAVVAGSRPMAVPAVVYLVVNLISYPALERINASVFTAISQLKVLATAFFAVLMLGTPISGRKWRTLTVMVLGVTLVSWESAPDADGLTKSGGDVIAWDYAVGIACAGVQTALSGFGSIYFEMMLKRGSVLTVGGGGTGLGGGERGPETFSVWDRNIQLAMYSIAIYLPMAFLDVGGANILEGWTPLVWGIACLHASGGVLVALSVLYSSSVTKTVAVCASLVLTTVMGNALFDAPLNGAIGLGCAVVVIAVFGYRDDCDVEEELRRLRRLAEGGPGFHRS
ncbi:Drug/Metabolite transporter superfamily [Micromonas commoda]|uniref:Drug/Metabolite transporter superfamily n=1 Tax=Micromonas commoda (strain RCC299 / NOUM17 / CCMP2709) TaxID=296587 RepID=C1DZM7_MICCC|nr:Drug/Metabolite transporter superfamily [Micromonas commoda]ACO61146.1 Drug/Metabolite transporter superfamily [Micromonas commoda]|eukprot:XP_002499888.1 Drug/Metabolite transporter superfamily [Micromonas commoda]